MTALTIDDSAAALEPVAISFQGSAAPMIGLGAINGILKVATLGLYSFWAKTEVRRRLWSATRLNGEPVAYTGTGKELLLGFLIVFGAIFVPALIGGLVVSFIYAGSQSALAAYQTVLYLIFFLLIGNAIYRAQRYRLSRTEWRGIRGALVGSPGRYGWAYFWTLAAPVSVIIALAAGISYTTAPAVGGIIMLFGLLAVLWVLPWRANYLQGLLTRDMRFGDRPLSYTGTAAPLYRRYVFAWLGSILIVAGAIAATGIYVVQSGMYERQLAGTRPTALDVAPIAIIWLATIVAIAVVTAWYRASQINHFAGHTHFENARFRGEATGRTLMWLVLTNWLISIAGIAIGVLAGGLLVYLFAPHGVAPGPGAETAGIVGLLLVIPPIIVATTIAATLAQFRSARYIVSRLKLDGAINLGIIMQSQSQLPKRGEGLAQVFDIDGL